MIGQYTTVLGEADINVSDMTNKAKGDYAYAPVSYTHLDVYKRQAYACR